MAGRALAAGRQHHAALVGAAQHLQQRLVVRGPGAAAVAFQHHSLHATAEQCFHLAGADAGEQRQHGEVHRLAPGAVVEPGRNVRGALRFAATRQLGEGVKGLRAQLAGAGAV
ncbi:hypothetical protein FQZ97_843310 [compost metagenome]